MIPNFQQIKKRALTIGITPEDKALVQAKLNLIHGKQWAERTQEEKDFAFVWGTILLRHNLETTTKRYL
jgi:hypothetical protein